MSRITPSVDPNTVPPCTAEQFQRKLDDLKQTIDGIEWALATDSEGKLSAGAYVEARNLVKALVDQAQRLSQPLVELETPVIDREATLLAAVDRLSPNTRYGYVRYIDLANASYDARYNPHYLVEDAQGNRRWEYPLHDLLEDLVKRDVLEKSATGDYRRYGARGRGARVGESTTALLRRRAAASAR